MSDQEVNLTIDKSQPPAEAQPARPVPPTNQDRQDYQDSQKPRTPDSATILRDGLLLIPPLPELQESKDSGPLTSQDLNIDSKTTTFRSADLLNSVQMATLPDGSIQFQALGYDSNGYPNGQQGGSLKIAPDGTATVTFPDGHVRPGPNGEEPISFSHQEMADFRAAANPHGSLDLTWNNANHKISFQATPGEDPAKYKASQALKEQQTFGGPNMESIELVLHN